MMPVSLVLWLFEESENEFACGDVLPPKEEELLSEL